MMMNVYIIDVKSSLSVMLCLVMITWKSSVPRRVP